jgi:hypothetical protein
MVYEFCLSSRLPGGPEILSLNCAKKRIHACRRIDIIGKPALSCCLVIDIHCHILPGMDDGPESFEMSCEMAEMAIAEGVTHVIATPHATQNHPFIPNLVRQRCDEMQVRNSKAGWIFATGCDFHLSFENLQEIRRDPERFTLNQKNYLLRGIRGFLDSPRPGSVAARTPAGGH